MQATIVNTYFWNWNLGAKVIKLSYKKDKFEYELTSVSNP